MTESNEDSTFNRRIDKTEEFIDELKTLKPDVSIDDLDARFKKFTNDLKQNNLLDVEIVKILKEVGYEIDKPLTHKLDLDNVINSLEQYCYTEGSEGEDDEEGEGEYEEDDEEGEEEGEEYEDETTVSEKPKSIPEKQVPDDETTNQVDQQNLEDDEFYKIFKLFDANGDGKISYQEIFTALRAYGKELTKDEKDKMMHRISDIDKDGISFKEFSKLMDEFLPKDFDIMESVKDIFEAFDKNGDGVVSLEELKWGFQQLCSNANKELDEEKVEWILQMADEDGNGEIDFDEFIKALKNYSQIRKYLEDLIKPSPLEYLQVFTQTPSAFRMSILYQEKKKGNTTSNFVHPYLNNGGLDFSDLALDAEKKLMKCLGPINWKVILKKAEGVPNPGVGMTVVCRKAYLILFDGTNFLSNVFEVRAQSSSSSPDTWYFGQKIEGKKFQKKDIKILVRHLDNNNVDLKLLIELVIVARAAHEDDTINNPVGKLHEISCGWSTIDIGKKGYENNKINRVSICGGTPFSQEPINKEYISKGTTAFARMKNILRGIPESKIDIYISEHTQTDELNFALMPVNIIMNIDHIGILEQYRFMLARALLDKKEPNDKMKPVVNPSLKYFPKLLDDEDLWNLFVQKWSQKFNKIRRKSIEMVEEEFSKMILTTYPSLFAVNIPEKEYGNEISKRTLFVQKMMEDPIECTCKLDHVFKPFDVSEMVYDFME